MHLNAWQRAELWARIDVVFGRDYETGGIRNFNAFADPIAEERVLGPRAPRGRMGRCDVAMPIWNRKFLGVGNPGFFVGAIVYGGRVREVARGYGTASIYAGHERRVQWPVFTNHA